jgi:hypothetical protein
MVQIAGHTGQVEKWTLRATWLRDSAGHLHVLSNRDVRDVIVQSRAEPEEIASPSFDPLAASANTPKRGKPS